MNTTLTMISLAVAYAAVLAVLIGILIAPRIAALGRVAAAVAAAGLFLLTYLQVGELRGWPSDTQPPASFQLHWARVIEPDPLQGDSGRIYLWLEELDENNYPSGTPRAYTFPYSAELAGEIDGAMAKIQAGNEMAGQITEEREQEVDEQSNERREIGEGAEGIGERVLHADFGELAFVAMPAPVTPEKPQ
jgi:hypothetical protein